MTMTPATWIQLAEDLGARYIRAGSQSSVTLKVYGGTICLERIRLNRHGSGGDGHKTRLSGTYAQLDDFLFSVRSNTPLQKLATLVGMQDLEIGDTEFDAAFVVRANDAQKAQELFADEMLRQLLLSVHRKWWFTIEARDFLDDDPHKLMTVLGCRRAIVWERDGLEGNEQFLSAIFETFERMLRRLCEIGSATPDD